MNGHEHSGLNRVGPVCPARTADQTHYLYVAVVVAIVLGITVGFLFPEFAIRPAVARRRLRRADQDDDPAGDLLHASCSVSARSRSAASVGKVGGLALAYFLTMSTVALAIGLVVGNLHRPGRGPEPHRRARRGGREAGRGRRLHHRVHRRHRPDSLFSALTSGEVLQTLLVALLVGFALQSWAARASPILVGIGHLQRLVFRVLAMIMWAAPSAPSARWRPWSAQTGWDALKSLAVLMTRLLHDLLHLRLRRPRHPAQAGHRA